MKSELREKVRNLKPCPKHLSDTGDVVALGPAQVEDCDECLDIVIRFVAKECANELDDSYYVQDIERLIGEKL